MGRERRPAKGSPTPGAARAMWGGFAKGSVVDVEAPRRVVELWRSKYFPKDAKDSVLEVSFDKKGDGTMIDIRQWGFAKVPGRPIDYETMMFWSQKVFGAFQVHYSSRGDAPAKKAEASPAAKKKRAAAIAVGDLSEIPWAYALEPKADLEAEARLAAESARKALGAKKNADASVRAAIRKELEAWLAS